MKSRVLIIEDEVKMAKLLELDLNDAGFQVMVAHDGAIGWQLAQKQEPDVIVLDWQLPTLTGLEVCQRLRKAGQRMPIIFTTALSDHERRQAALTAGADDYLTKPFATEELIERIRKYQPSLINN